MKKHLLCLMAVIAPSVCIGAGPFAKPAAVPELDSSCLEKRDGNTVRYGDRDIAAKGNFYIKTEPSGATVFLNGKMIRNVVTPLTIEDLPAGDYIVTAEKADSGKSVEVSLKANEFRKVDLTLEKKLGCLSVTTNVAEAEVYLDGKFLGRAPLNTDSLCLGTFDLLVRKEGYIDFTARTVISEQEEALIEAGLERPGPLKVLSAPLEADVYFDNEHRGVTPVILDSMRPGTHVLELRREGYAVLVDTVEISSRDETKVEATLEPLKGIGAVGKDDERSGVGGGFDRAMKWITIAGSAAFVSIMVLVFAL